MSQFYNIYERLFGVQNCTYNTHVLCSHVLKMRKKNFTSISCFPFENFYSELRDSYSPGTQSPLKQIFSKCLLKKVISNHSCYSPVYLSNNDTCLECNSLIYIRKNANSLIYLISDINEDELLCHPVGKHPYQFNSESVDWASVGVFRTGGIAANLVTISKNLVKGKVLRVSDLLITCPNNILQEK